MQTITKIFSFALLAVGILAFFLFKDLKEQYIASAFGAFVGVALGVAVQWWAAEKQNKKEQDGKLKVLDSHLQNCITLTNSNLGVLKEIINKGTIATFSNLQISMQRLSSTLTNGAYLTLMNSGLQSLLRHDLEHTILYVNAKVVDLKGQMESQLVLGLSHYGPSGDAIRNV